MWFMVDQNAGKGGKCQVLCLEASMPRYSFLILVALVATSFAEDQPCAISFRVVNLVKSTQSLPAKYVQVTYPAGVKPPPELSKYELRAIHQKDGKTVVFLKPSYEFAEPGDKLADLASYKLDDLRDADHHCIVGGIVSERPVPLPHP
jgi:hypothetical protein